MPYPITAFSQDVKARSQTSVYGSYQAKQLKYNHKDATIHQ